MFTRRLFGVQTVLDKYAILVGVLIFLQSLAVFETSTLTCLC